MNSFPRSDLESKKKGTNSVFSEAFKALLTIVPTMNTEFWFVCLFFRATTNRKLKETVALELSFVNSNLQLLKEQLAELNSSVELYQNDK